MNPNAACPRCGCRHIIARDTKGYIEVINCSACPPTKTLQGIAISSGDADMYSKDRKKLRRAARAEPLGPETSTPKRPTRLLPSLRNGARPKS